MTKSVITFIRKELGYKGPSKHSGRGFTEMFSTEEISYSDVAEKIQSLLPKWREKNLVIEAEVTDTNLRILFRQTVFGYSRAFYVSEEMMKHCLKYRMQYFLGRTT